MEQARPDSTLLPAAEMEVQHTHNGSGDRDGRISRMLTALPADSAALDGAPERADPPLLPAPGSDEAVAAWEAARSAFDRQTSLDDAAYAGLRIGDSFTLWTTERVRDVQRGDFSWFVPREMEGARSKTPAELSSLLVLTTRRDLQFAEAEQRTGIRALYDLAYPNGEDPEPLPDPEGDLAHVVIAEHRAAYAAWKPLRDAWNETTTDHDAFEAAQDEPYRVQDEAFGDLIDTRASTVAGLVALAAYLFGAVHDANCIEVEEEARRALRSMCSGVLSLFGPEADAPLIALEAEFLATDAVMSLAIDAQAEASEVYRATKPEMPMALKARGGDLLLSGIPQTEVSLLADGKCRLSPYGAKEVAFLRANPCMGVYIGGTGGEKLPGGGWSRPDVRAQLRADAIVADIIALTGGIPASHQMGA